MADLTTVLEKSKPGYAFQTIVEQRVYNVGVGDEGMSGAKAVGTHNLADIAVGEAVVGGRVIFLEDVTSTGAATIKFQSNSEDLTAALAIAGMAAGEVVEFDLVSAGLGIYADTTAITLDMVVGTEVLSAGRFLIILDVVDVLAATTRG